ncbi:ParB/RepB/Spo0J family partition protein [Rubrobacter marinus]|uniref:ParB/RepB/Spo0J family partition protein n=1 Tax=Rubrobacter marinus TaxID=2653852 RepID=A0A6G8Q274_9ACTN|nr:ParB/RepB/Spo0J family partition protein [Rubrobacter marinus]QIN80566.1 ParB/RepB/Spo0J family partition protein [Rubrobacter marinus]
MGRRGLGRGLSALISTGESVGGLRFEEVPVSAIRPNTHQPRRSFGEAGIRELAASIREVGILQPLVIRATENGFELIAGERRLRAAKEAGLDRVPVLIRQAAESESMELALVENLQREDLNPLETAAAYQALMDSFGFTKEQLAERLGKSRTAVTNTLRLTRLPASIRALILEGELTEGHARALLPLEEEGWMLRVADRIITEKLSVRRTEEIVREELADPEPQDVQERSPQRRPEEEYGDASRRLQEALGLPAKVKASRKGGKIEIRFRSGEELEGLLTLLISQTVSE